MKVISKYVDYHFSCNFDLIGYIPICGELNNFMCSNIITLNFKTYFYFFFSIYILYYIQYIGMYVCMYISIANTK